MLVSEAIRRQREERFRSLVPFKPEDRTAFDCQANDQIGFIMSPADERWIFGGNRSGKTETVVYDCLLFCLGKHPVRTKHQPPPVKIRYCAPKWRDNVEKVILAKFRTMVPRNQLVGGTWRNGYSATLHLLSFKNGTTISFKSFEEERDTFGGDDLDAVYQDEHSPEDRYIENQARLVDRDGFFASAMTPEEGVTWEDDHVENPPEDVTIDTFQFSMYGNPALSPKGVKKAEAKYRDPGVRAVKMRGEFLPLHGKVLPQWDPKHAIIPTRKLHRDAYRVFCIDTHHRTPCAAMWGAWEPESSGNEFRFVVYRCIKAFLTVPQWQKRIRHETGSEKIQLWLGDEPGGGEGKDINEAESIIAQFNQGPMAIPLVQVKKVGDRSYSSGIARLWNMLTVDQVTNQTQFYVMQSALFELFYFRGKPQGDLAWELKRFRYKKEQKQDEESLREKVVTQHIHLIDDARYLTGYRPGCLSTQQPESALTDAWD